MSGDYKYEMQMLAEDIALEDYGMDFYSLNPAKQHEVFSRAMEEWSERQASRADYLNDCAKEGRLP